jgi:Asp-tRNA(Asn)/Glu-tRNA(Gln) amidotransferase A subunit family amidase
VIDIVLTPTMMCAPLIIPKGKDAVHKMHKSNENALMGKFVGKFNQIPVPSITVPVLKDKNEMPAGVLMWGMPHEDKKLLEIALAFEKALNGETKTFPMTMNKKEKVI